MPATFSKIVFSSASRFFTSVRARWGGVTTDRRLSAFRLALGLICLGGWLVCGPGARLRAEETASSAGPLPYLVALDFASDFDGGKLGRQVGTMFRAKSERAKLFTVDAEVDWEERAGAMSRPALDADPATVAAAAKTALNCGVLVWGEIQAPNADLPKQVRRTKLADFTTRDPRAAQLFFHVRALDLRQTPPALVVSETFECANNYELRFKVEEVLKRLTGAPTTLDELAARDYNFQKPAGPNLCPLGGLNVRGEAGLGFPAAGDPQKLTGLMRTIDATKMTAGLAALFPGWSFPFPDAPLALPQSRLKGLTPEELAKLRADPATPRENCIILPLEVKPGEYDGLVFRMPNETAAFEGLFCYSPYIPIKENTHYQASFRVKTLGPEIKLFVKGYRDLPVTGYENAKFLRQETYKFHKVFYGKKGEWQDMDSRPFLPRSAKPEHQPQFLRIELYSYWPEGVVYFDDVSLRACEDTREKKEPPE